MHAEHVVDLPASSWIVPPEFGKPPFSDVALVPYPYVQEIIVRWCDVSDRQPTAKPAVCKEGYWRAMLCWPGR